MFDSYEQLRLKVAAGELKAAPKPLAADAKPEQIAAWRKEQGLPETAEAYVKDMKLGDGLVISDADKPLVESFSKAAAAANVPQDAFNSMVDWYYGVQDQQAAARAEADQTFHDTTLAELAQEWGTETKQNQRAIGNLMEMAPGGLTPDGLGTAILMARLPNGRILGDDPNACRFLTQLSREMFPQSTIVPPGTPNAGQFIDSEIASIRETYLKAIGGDREAHRAYYGHDGKPGLDARQRELIDTQAKMKARAA